MKFNQPPLEIDCTSLDAEHTRELADRLTACFERVDVWGNDSITAEKPLSHNHYATAWNIRLNPPYSTDLIGQFTDKLIHSDFNQAIVLVNNATDIEWFCKLAERADAVVFPKGRVKFHKPDGSTGAPLQGHSAMPMCRSGKCWLSSDLLTPSNAQVNTPF